MSEKPTEVPTEASKKVDFQFDIASKAVVESISPLLENFSIDNLMKIIPELIKHVEMYKDFTGQQKRTMVISMLRHLIDITDGPGDDQLLDPILKHLVPSIIDTLVEVDKGRLRLTHKKWKKGCLTLFKSCMCCGPQK